MVFSYSCGDSRLRKALYAVMGRSPAVLTETVWALARLDPPWIPDTVTVVTTLPGARAIRERLFKCGGWGGLLKALKASGRMSGGAPAFGPAQGLIRVIPSTGGGDMEDLIYAEDNERAADFIMAGLHPSIFNNTIHSVKVFYIWFYI